MSKLRELRERMSLTQKELSEKLDISHVSLSFYENNTRYPSIKIRRKLLDFFGPDDLKYEDLIPKKVSSQMPIAGSHCG